MKIRIQLIVISLILLLTAESRAQQNLFYTLNYSKSRAIGLGAAFTAVEGGLATAFYNPATFRFAQADKGIKFSLVINPLVSAGIFHYYSNHSGPESTSEKWLRIVQTLPKAVVLSTPNFEASFINHEELESRESFHPNTQFFEGDDFFDHHVESFVLRVRLADQIQMGGTINYYTAVVNDTLQRGLGSSYGIYIRTHPKLDVGIVFISMPGKMKNLHLNYDRFEDETVNVGMAYHPFHSTTLAVDVRNLTEESQQTTRELHFGFEQGILNQFFLRAGFYRDRNLAQNRLTVGFGLLNLKPNRYDHPVYQSPNLVLNYALMIEPGNRNSTRWHFLSFQWGFGW